jgi:DNA polymerase I
MKAWAGERRDTPLGFDTETGGLQPAKDALRLIQLGDSRRGWAVPFQLWGGGALEILNAYEGELVAHNASFDSRFLMVHAEWKPPWHKLHDTMTMAHLVNPLRPKGLKALANRLVDPRASAGEQVLHDGMRQQGWDWSTVPFTFDPYWIYSALDPVLTCYIWQKLAPEVTAQYSQVYDLERAVTRIITMMMLKGMKIDVAYVSEKLSSILEYSATARSWLLTEHLVSSPMSGREIAAALEAQGQKIEWHTEHGLPQIDKDALGWYRDNPVTPAVQQLCETVLAVRHAEKMAGTYLENLLKLRDRNDTVHASIWALGARTGRMSITDPALQTLPRDDLIVRGAFVPRPGNVFISIDADQIEARLAAHFSEDTGLIQAFKEADEGGRDFFCGVASTIFGENVEKNDKRRQMTKNCVYGSLYGAGAPKMAITAGVPLTVMGPVKENFDAAYPGLKKLTDRILTEARVVDPPSIRTPLGRRLVADHGREYTQLTNAKIQGHAAEILKQGLLDLDAAGLGEALLLPIHDEVILEVKTEDAEEVLRLASSVLTNRDSYLVPLTWSGKIMPERWRKL